MARHILIRNQGGGTLLPEARFALEEDVHSAVAQNPQLIPASDFELGDLLVVDREAQAGNGYADLICVDASGQVVVVEFKRGPENPDSRRVVAQLLEYGAYFWQMSPDEFEQRALSYFRSPNCPDGRLASAISLEEALGLDASPTDSQTEATRNDEQFDFRTALGRNLSNGSVVYLIVSSKIDASLRRVMEYLNATSSFRVGAVEIDYFGGSECEIMVPRSITAHTSKPRSSVSPGRTDRETFMTAMGPERREYFESLLDSLTEIGMQVQWGTKGCALKFRSGGKLVTFMHVYPPTTWWLKPEGVPEIDAYIRPTGSDKSLARPAYAVWRKRLEPLGCWTEFEKGGYLSLKMSESTPTNLQAVLIEAAQDAAQCL